MDETYIESDPECDDTYHEGMCETCDHFEICLRGWQSE